MALRQEVNPFAARKVILVDNLTSAVCLRQQTSDRHRQRWVQRAGLVAGVENHGLILCAIVGHQPNVARRCSD